MLGMKIWKYKVYNKDGFIQAMAARKINLVCQFWPSNHK